ncbi:MAG: aconitate hydratase [Candidatus Methanofastidiosia archaeon]
MILLAKNIVEKIIENHIVEENDTEIGISIDQTLTQDATGTMVYLELESIGINKVKTELSVSYVDHNTLQCGSENADDHLYLQTVADNLGVIFSRPGNGICHQVHLERFCAPAKTLLGSDSHTPTCGGVGCLAIGAGGIDVAAAMAGEPYYMPKPRMLKINLEEKLSPLCGAKDIILHILSVLTTKGNVGYVVEYGGKGVKTLSVAERATICNMGAELGVTTSIFPTDKMTERFFKAQRREKDYTKIQADKNAEYDKTITINLEDIEPLIAKPHSPDNVAFVTEMKGTKIGQVCIGSCTNSSLYDMAITCEILRGKRVAKDVDLVISPASRQVFIALTKMGMLDVFLKSGARITEPACGFCIGNGQSPATGTKSLRTSNRNFYGRSGTHSAEVYLSGVRVAAFSAIDGKITLPRAVDENSAQIRESKYLDRIEIDDSMFIYPTGKEKIIKGPNIGPPPHGTPIEDSISGIATIKVGDKVTTDDIMPAGQRLKFRSNIPKYSQFVFENIDKNFPERTENVRNSGKVNVIIAGSSYGQGSSREHAAICPAYLGVRCIVCKSIERIHRANLINFGIIPLIFKKASDYDSIDEGDLLELHEIKKCLKTAKFVLFDTTADTKISLEGAFTPREQEYLLAGGKLNAIGGKDNGI